MPTYPLPTLAATVGATGISAPAYNDILLSLQASYQTIYGADIVLAPDTQDGQWLAIMAKAIADSNQTAIAVFGQFSPATAQGAGLSSVVKINGIARLVPSNSSADVLIVGQAGATISNGAVGDSLGLNTEWNLPSEVIIPPGGSITVTAICTTPGAVNAAANSITKIMTPTFGWQTVNNPANASPGAPVELDASLRRRQTISTQLAASSSLGAIVGAIANLAGVTAYQPYENDTDSTDGNGLPPHSFCISVLGGDAQSIINIIGHYKSVGANTYGGGAGATSGTYVDPLTGIVYTLYFNIPSEITIKGTITIVPGIGYTTAIGNEIIAAVVAMINDASIGESIRYTRLYGPALLVGPYAAPASPSDSATYALTSIVIAIGSGAQSAADIAIGINQVAVTTAADWTLTT